jgi:hypothetical protein
LIVAFGVTVTAGADYMNIGDMVKPGEQGEPVDSLQADVPSWESRTAEQLREILNRGLAAGDAFTGAAAEIERRASDTARRARQLPSEIDDSRRRHLLIAKLCAVAVAAAIGAAVALYRLLS